MQVPERVYHHDSRFKQRGAALIVIMFIIGLAAAALLIKSYNADSLRLQQEEKTMRALGQAKEALIAWSTSHPNWPGVMPFPDRGDEGSGAGYDGKSDCVTVGLNYGHLIGELALLGDGGCLSPQHGIGQTFTDSSGETLWYAVSINLIRISGAVAAPIINPGIINNVDPDKDLPYDSSATSSSYPWLIVKDINGNIVSDRVAAVIIAPGPPLAGQSRTNTATSAHFLDQITVGATTYSNWDYDQPDEDFVMGGDATLSNTFNDRLVFITIDELMFALERRAAAEARDALKQYQSVLGRYPYAAPLGSAGNYSCVDATVNGLLPLDSNPSNACACTSARNCSCNFGIIDSVAFNGGWPNWDNTDGSCSASGSTCTCTNAGYCSFLFGIFRFDCDATGNCDSNLIPGTFEFSGVFENINVNTSSGDCHHTCGNTTVTCNGNGTFSTGNCGDPGIAPTLTVNLVAGSNQVTTVSDFNIEQVVAGMKVFGDGIPDDAVVTSVINSTTLVMSRNATLTGFAEVTFSRLSKWFKINGWQDYIYYAMARDAMQVMTVGGRTGIEALLATVGATIDVVPFAESKGGPQSRVSCNIDDYLDSLENVNANQVYEATNKQKALNYNDQLFIVAP